MLPNWSAVDDDEIMRQQAEIMSEYYPFLTQGGGTLAPEMRKVLQWVSSVDLVKGDDPLFGKLNWSYTAKHACEKAIRSYVANSELVLAAIMCGYLPIEGASTSCSFKHGWWHEHPSPLSVAGTQEFNMAKGEQDGD